MPLIRFIRNCHRLHHPNPKMHASERQQQKIFVAAIKRENAQARISIFPNVDFRPERIGRRIWSVVKEIQWNEGKGMETRKCPNHQYLFSIHSPMKYLHNHCCAPSTFSVSLK